MSEKLVMEQGTAVQITLKNKTKIKLQVAVG